MKALVMIVDDHAFVREMLRTVFEAEGLEVCEAANGVEAIQAIQRSENGNPSLVILDLSMPVMNGLEAAENLKMVMPHVPLLMFTNHLKQAVEKQARAVGISAVVSKFDSDALHQLVGQARALLGLDPENAQRAS